MVTTESAITPNAPRTLRPVPIKSSAGTQSRDSGYKIAVRFGDQVLEAGFTSVPNLVLNHYAELGISPAEMMFTIHMWQFRWTERDPYPSLTTIADKMDVSWRQAHRYAGSLKDKGFLIIKSRQEPGRGQVTSEYDFEPLIKAVLKLDEGADNTGDIGGTGDRGDTGNTGTNPDKNADLPAENTPLTKMTGGGMTELTEAPLTRVSEEEYKEQEDPSQEDLNLSNIRRAKSLEGSKSSEERANTKQKTQAYQQPKSDGTVARGAKEGGGRNGSIEAGKPQGFSSIADTLAHSNSRLPPQPYGEERQVIMDYIEKFAKEFSDHASLKTSTTRAYNLFTKSRVPLGAFIGRMYEAHAITKESAADVPRRPASVQSGTTGTSGITAMAQRGRPAKNRMAYWFSVLEDRLGLRVQKASRGVGREAEEDVGVHKSS